MSRHRELGYCACGQILLCENQKIWHPWWSEVCFVSKQRALGLEDFRPADDSLDFARAFDEFRERRRWVRRISPPVIITQKIEDLGGDERTFFMSPEQAERLREHAHKLGFFSAIS